MMREKEARAMIRGFFPCLAAVVALTAATTACAAPKSLVLLTPGEIDVHRFLAPPPSDDAPRVVAERAALKALIAETTPARMAQARWDDAHEDPSLFQPTLGPGFDMAKLPATAALLGAVQNDADAMASAAKKTFPRNRPWAADAAIKTCDPDDKPLTSYPSGHAIIGYTLAMTLAAAMPEREEALLARASDFAYSREICGAHYASDAEGSHALAAVIFSDLVVKPAFQTKLAAARAELASAGLASPAR